MNKSQLVKSMSKKSKLTQKDCKVCLEALTKIIEQSLKTGENINLVGFGKFDIKYRNSRNLFNPYTKKNIMLPASKMPVFKPGKTLKEAIY